MFRKLAFALSVACLFVIHVSGQTTNGLITGLVTDSTGAVVPGAQVSVTNEGTGLLRTGSSGGDGIYLVPQLSPGVYSVSITKQGFATQQRRGIQLQVNQSVTLDFKLGAGATTQTITVTGVATGLNTTSATLSTVVDHQEMVDLPLNGRQFTQLAELTPGVAPQENSQQSTFTVGVGGISPAINGQRGYQNNFTMDGTLNNEVYTDVWAIAPPPDAIQEFNVQSHITDAQFAVSSGANINLVTRSGTNSFHGDLWEFLRNNDFDAKSFPQTTPELPYHQDQYGLYVGGPIIAPHVFNGKDNTWFSFYWEAYYSNSYGTALASTLTPLMRQGNFAAELVPETGTNAGKAGEDCYGANLPNLNQIYDATTVDSGCPSGKYGRMPFDYNGQLNVIPPGEINAVIPTILTRYYPLPNMNVPEGTFPNYTYTSTADVNQGLFGLRIDRKLTDKDSIFLRFNRNKATRATAAAALDDDTLLKNYAQQGAFGYTHVFNPKEIVNFRVGYTYANDYNGLAPAGSAFADSINFSEAYPEKDGIQLGPNITITNGFLGVVQTATPLGPFETFDYHVDLVKMVGNHTLGGGVVYEHLRGLDDGFHASPAFTTNGTSYDGSAGKTGYGAASFMLGIVDSYAPNAGETSADQTVNWYGYYLQDQWQATKKLVLTAGLRWDYVSPPNYHKIVSGLDVLTGQYIVTGPVPGYFQQATGPSGFFSPQYNGYEPRFGITYRADQRTAIHSAVAILDDHNNTLVQENQNIRLSWPTGIAANILSQDLTAPEMYINKLPTATSLVAGLPPYTSYGGNTNNRIPYSIEYNLGVEEQVSNTMVLKVDYVGSVSRFQYIVPEANTAPTPGPGTVQSRSPYGSYGNPFSFSWNIAPGSYNALQTSLRKTLSSGLSFLASYTWSKNMDWDSDPYNNTEEDFYDLRREWGPSAYSYKHMLVVSGLYALPFGQGKRFGLTSNRFVQAVAGNWNFGEIFSALSGQPFDVINGSDIANTGAPAGSERANRIVGVSPYTPKATRTPATWLNKAAFALPAAYTFGNETRDDLIGPVYRNLTCDVMKNFPIHEETQLQFRAEAFNALNMTNYALPNATADAGAFGQINGAAGGRELQFALKLMF